MASGSWIKYCTSRYEREWGIGKFLLSTYISTYTDTNQTLNQGSFERQKERDIQNGDN